MSDVYELVERNEHFLVVYKKPGISFHSDSGNLPGLFETVKQHEGLQELYPVHRLDKVTSGLLVMARTADVNQELVNQFKQRLIEKYYLAISAKKPKKKQGLIKGDMQSARRGAWKLLPTSTNAAVTQIFSGSLEEGRRLYIVKPYTGKTHQIRVALKSIGAPILGDALYADSLTSENMDRTYLHAYSLAFSVKGQQFRFTELPREGIYFLNDHFNSAIANFREPWKLLWPKI